MRMGTTTVLVSALLVLAATFGAAFPMDEQPLNNPAEILQVSSIMLPQLVDNNLSCLVGGQECRNDNQCCQSMQLACRNWGSGIIPPVSKCQWCPAAGDGCGIGWTCCPGFRCSGLISGTCRRR